MGLDALIYVKTKNGELPNFCNDLPRGAELIPYDDCGGVDATFEVSTTWRFYGPGYERGPWPIIAHTLMALLACDNVDAVWYFSDASDGGEPQFTREQVLEYAMHYMREGDRPYRKPLNSAVETR